MTSHLGTLLYLDITILRFMVDSFAEDCRQVSVVDKHYDLKM